MGEGTLGDPGWASSACWISWGEAARGDGVFCISPITAAWLGGGTSGERTAVTDGGIGCRCCSWGGGVGVDGFVMIVGFCLMKLASVSELSKFLGGWLAPAEGGVCWGFWEGWAIGVDWLLRWTLPRMWFKVCWRICNCCSLLRNRAYKDPNFIKPCNED